MAFNPKARLREFYDQALLTPELLCLNCSYTAWNRAGCKCSERRREDCAWFVNHMVNRLGLEQAPEKNDRPPEKGIHP